MSTLIAVIAVVGSTHTLVAVSEIAELIVPPGAGRAAVIERLRAWADAGLLKPAGELNPGTGRHRVFLDTEILVAALLNTLADAGVTVGKQRNIIEQVRKRWRPCQRALRTRYLNQHQARGAGPSVFLEVDQSKPEVFIHSGAVHNFCSKADSSLVIDLGKLLARIETRKLKNRPRGAKKGRERTKSS
jgi:DNA-binding transcriptional MerR regulator